MIMGLEVSRNITRSRASELDLANFLMMGTCAPAHFDSPGFHCALTLPLMSSFRITRLVTNSV